MAASSKLMITEADKRYPVRIKIEVPAGGLGQRLTHMQTWLDETCGADGWAMTPAGLRNGPVNDAVAVYFLDATLAAGFVSRWCSGVTMQISEGAFHVREDSLAPRISAPAHSWPR